MAYLQSVLLVHACVESRRACQEPTLVPILLTPSSPPKPKKHHPMQMPLLWRHLLEPWTDPEAEAADDLRLSGESPALGTSPAVHRSRDCILANA